VTLIELMVALAITMIMMTAVITLFANVTTTVSNSRALIEISERLRTARNRLQLDLAGHTATTIPPLRPEDGEGYLEIIEGPNTDSGSYAPNSFVSPPLSPFGGVPNPINSTSIAYAGSFATGSANDLMGDADDVLMLTVRSQGEPFVGWAAGGVLTESGTAEVIWYAVPNGRSLPGDNTGALNGAPVQLYTLYRRVLLVAPLFVPSGVAFTGNTPKSISQFYNQFDLSVRSNSTTGNAVGNSLTDLTARENRFLHPFQVATTPTTNLPTISSLTGWPNNAAYAWLSPSTSPQLNANVFPYAVQNPSYYDRAGRRKYPHVSDVVVGDDACGAFQQQRASCQQPAAGRRCDFDRRVVVRHSRVRSAGTLGGGYLEHGAGARRSGLPLSSCTRLRSAESHPSVPHWNDSGGLRCVCRYGIRRPVIYDTNGDDAGVAAVAAIVFQCFARRGRQHGEKRLAWLHTHDAEFVAIGDAYAIVAMHV
jgi:type II secretory pathway pseudopilin PulG